MIKEGAHACAFVIAGATRDEMLTDMRGAVDKAIEEGVAIQQFRKDLGRSCRNTAGNIPEQ